jgi:hypothetical protein
VSVVTDLQFVPILGRGDGTVPILSASRRWQGQDLNYPGAAVQGFLSTPDKIPWTWKNALERPFVVFGYEFSFTHGALPNNTEVTQRIWQILTTAAPPQTQADASLTAAEETIPPAQPAYYLDVAGDVVISVSDVLGNSTDTMTTTLETPVMGVTQYRTGQRSQTLIMPADQTYTVTLRAGVEPLMLDLTRGDAVSTTLAVRYLDLVIPEGKTAVLRVTPSGADPLRYDGDGDGTFETEVAPTIAVAGDQAADVSPPEVSLGIEGTWPTLRLTLSATDALSGVKRLMYSLNGTTYQPYVDPLQINALQVPIFYAFAEDSLANRSGRLSFTLAERVYSPVLRR